jgi:hypothetical protein
LNLIIKCRVKLFLGTGILEDWRSASGNFSNSAAFLTLRQNMRGRRTATDGTMRLSPSWSQGIQQSTFPTSRTATNSSARATPSASISASGPTNRNSWEGLLKRKLPWPPHGESSGTRTSSSWAFATATTDSPLLRLLGRTSPNRSAPILPSSTVCWERRSSWLERSLGWTLALPTSCRRWACSLPIC